MGGIRIVSRSSEVFADRKEAGQMLAKELYAYGRNNSVCLGILRGGIIVANEIAVELDVELDVVLSRKIGAPHNPELALGAVSEDGKLFVNPEVASYANSNPLYIEQEKKHQAQEIKWRSRNIRVQFSRVPLKGKTVIITDDGIATGATMQAALWSARQENPDRLICAVPVAPEESLEKLSEDADEVVCLRSPEEFYAVGKFYSNFEQVDDKTVLSVLKDFRNKENLYRKTNIAKYRAVHGKAH